MKISSRLNDSKILIDIVKLGLKIDIIAHTFYKSLAEKTDNKELHDFWLDISSEEQTHIDFWRETLEVAKKDMLPQIFDNPEEIRDEILSAIENIEKTLADKTIGQDVTGTFLAAFKIEFYGMHPALAPIFGLMRLISNKKNPENFYDQHILKFLNMFNKHCGKNNQGIEIIGETVLRLWKDNRKLSKQCYTDELTSLLNRRGFFRIVIPMLEMARRNKTTVALIIADIDHFKSINDTFGHQAGDQVLSEMHNIFKKTFRASDLICRYGGDEFIIFCPEIKKGGGAIISEKLKKATNSIKINDTTVTLSIGVIETIPKQGKNIEVVLEQIIKAADKLLYDVKKSGRNNISSKCM